MCWSRWCLVGRIGPVQCGHDAAVLDDVYPPWSLIALICFHVIVNSRDVGPKPMTVYLPTSHTQGMGMSRGTVVRQKVVCLTRVRCWIDRWTACRTSNC